MGSMEHISLLQRADFVKVETIWMVGGSSVVGECTPEVSTIVV
ncbi:hypothetical protein PI124_g12141 [Phytophthora idaei]|nr:hypothetical protein PI125_g11912 [Phytophthora idaei]KAG3155850.1 hypothetical protein PI126_g9004 [Phytophthora idaei]KAG3243044.1 hypothetical protein PI124_g12141 [Phytophthora idaei]